MADKPAIPPNPNKLATKAIIANMIAQRNIAFSLYRFFIKQDKHITEVDIEIAKPGEDIRIVPVKEAVEPRARKDGRTAFPGVTGDLAPCGEGDLYAC